MLFGFALEFQQVLNTAITVFNEMISDLKLHMFMDENTAGIKTHHGMTKSVLYIHIAMC